MKHQWLAYVIVGLLSIGAGVAIAGLPNNVPVDATIIPPSTTTAPEPTMATTTTTEVPDAGDSTTTTEAPTTTEAEPIDTTEPEPTLPDRSELAVVSANGANVSGTASRMAERLEGIGYVDVVPRDGTAIVELSTVYYADGFEESAARLADDLDLASGFIAPLAGSPQVLNLPTDVELLVYVGLDRAN